MALVTGGPCKKISCALQDLHLFPPELESNSLGPLNLGGLVSWFTEAG